MGCRLDQWVRDSWLAGIELRDIENNMAPNSRYTNEDYALAVATYRALEQRLRICTQLLDKY